MMQSVMKGKHQVFWLMLSAAGLVSGCGTPQINRIDKYRDIYETWPIEVKQAVLDGKVEVGMTPEMVVVSWGEPTEKVQRSNSAGDEEIWVYRKGGDDGTMMVPMGGGYPASMGGMGGSSIGIQTGRGGTGIIGGTGIGMGGTVMGSPGIGMGGPMGTGMGTAPVIMTRPTPAEEREVVFRNGVVYRADLP